MTGLEKAEARYGEQFRRLCELEPQLLVLRDEAASYREEKRDDEFCANAVWHGYYGEVGIKPRLVELVGWGRMDGAEELRTQDAYDAAYSCIYEQLPSCGPRCGCL